MKVPARSTDDYLSRLPPKQRATLEKLRRDIRDAAPAAEECITYGLPAFQLDGRKLVAFGAAAKHCSFYPMSSDTVADHAKELRRYDTSKGTIRFAIDRPLPSALVKKLVRARIAEIAREPQRRGQ